MGSPEKGIFNRDDTLQAYREFAAGGHVESDKNFVELAEREAAEARGKQLDEENYAALFGSSCNDELVDDTKKMTLVRRVSNGKGGSRGLWKGVWTSSQNARPHKKEEASLLDS